MARLITDSATPAPRTFWQRRFRDPIIAQLTQGITPGKIALTLAIGSCCALFPILGTTTLLCFLVGLLLRLNQPIIQLVNQALWPAQVSAIFGCVKVGEAVTGAAPVRINLVQMHDLFWASPAKFFQEFGATALHAVIGWAVLAPFYVLAVFYFTRPILAAANRLRTRTDARAAADPARPVP